MKNIILLSTLLFVSLAFVSNSQAKGGGGGGHSIGFGVGLMTASQDDFDSMATTVNATAGRNATKPGSGYEFSGFYEYRFSGTMFALHMQPSYVTQEGKGTTDTATLTGYTLFPIIRMYPLENSFIHFYMQAGLGYGKMSGKVTENSGAGTVEFSGGAFGALGGLGADFCFTPSHCMYLEGNFRYLPIERNVVSSQTGTITGFSQYGAGQELEINGTDLKTTMSGIIGSLGYTMNF